MPAKLSIIMRRLLLLLLCFPFISFSQVYDDFSDGDFTSNPEWTGTTQKMKINNDFQLQLNDSVAGTAYLTTANALATDCEWRFWIKQSFSPSGNNNSRVYLISNTQNITGDVHGYFLQLGEAGNNDAIELFRQDGNSVASVCRGTDGLISSSFNISVKVTRDNNGLWNIYVDKNNTGVYIPEATGTDNIYTQTGFFGFFAKYTKSNSKKFYWDDVYIGDIIIDNEPPVIENVSVLSDSSLLINFDEAVDSISSQNFSNYAVDHNIGHPISITYGITKVTLTFAGKFQNNVTYILTVSGISDIAGNVMEQYQTQFSYYSAFPGDIVFNEIFPDPNPPVGLPPYEFLELFNRTGNIISLNNWTLTIGNSEKTFENVSIQPDGYLLVGDIDAAGDYSQYGTFYGFGSFSLTNSGQTLTLKNQNGEIINAVSYKKSWYKDPDKDDGGWTLEKINPDNICSGEENWKASIDINGGTPGKKNSVYDSVFLYPSLKNYSIIAGDVIELIFNQTMDKESLTDIDNYEIDNGIGHPSGAFPVINDDSKVDLYLSKPLENGVIYNLTISGNIKNCIGVEIGKDTVITLGIPETINKDDIIINEILFNPLAGCEDYVEIYNRSDKLLDISYLQIGSVKISPPNPPDTSWYAVADKQILMFPSEYLVLTKSPGAVKNCYSIKNPGAFIEVNPFASYNNENGTVILKADSVIIDDFTYDESMHYPLLNYVKGVSLERINPYGETNDRNNWHSAAESAGFGTPGYQNSQFFIPGEQNEEIKIEPEVFSPDEDGVNDVVNLIYKFNKPGYNITVTVFDKNGIKVRTLAENRLAGTNGTISWDGVTDWNTKANVGIYVFYIKVFDTDGNVKAWKKTAVLATKW